MTSAKFPNDRKIKVIGRNGKTRTVWQSEHLISIHKWTDSEVRVMQLNNIKLP